jgi:hypothetical protein
MQHTCPAAHVEFPQATGGVPPLEADELLLDEELLDEDELEELLDEDELEELLDEDELEELLDEDELDELLDEDELDELLELEALELLAAELELEELAMGPGAAPPLPKRSLPETPPHAAKPDRPATTAAPAKRSFKRCMVVPP